MSTSRFSLSNASLWLDEKIEPTPPTVARSQLGPSDAQPDASAALFATQGTSADAVATIVAAKNFENDGGRDDNGGHAVSSGCSSLMVAT